MKQPRDLALLFLALADRDIKTCRQLPKFPIAMTKPSGLTRSRQSKNVSKRSLLRRKPLFERRTTLMELIDLLHDRLHLTPLHLDMLDQLTPFAVTFRYEFLDLEPVSRGQIRAVVQAIRYWTEQHIE
jgi:hypothetical protein